MKIETLFMQCGIDLSKFNSNLENNREIDELLTVLSSKLCSDNNAAVDIIQELAKKSETNEQEDFVGVIRKDDTEYNLNVIRSKNDEELYFGVFLEPTNPEQDYRCKIVVRDHDDYIYNEGYQITYSSGNGFCSSIVCTENIKINGNPFYKATTLVLGDYFQYARKHLISDLYPYQNENEISTPISRIIIDEYGEFNRSFNCLLFPLNDKYSDNDSKDIAYLSGLYSIHEKYLTRDELFISDSELLVNSFYSYEKELNYDKLVNKHFNGSNIKI